jgi:hypothetical protein
VRHSALEDWALKQFSEDMDGGLECQCVLRTWFARLKKQGDPATAEYGQRITEAVKVLEAVRAKAFRVCFGSITSRGGGKFIGRACGLGRRRRKLRSGLIAGSLPLPSLRPCRVVGVERGILPPLRGRSCICGVGMEPASHQHIEIDKWPCWAAPGSAGRRVLAASF